MSADIGQKLGIGLLLHKITTDLHELRRRYVDYHVKEHHEYPNVAICTTGRISRAIMEMEAVEEEL